MTEQHTDGRLDSEEPEPTPAAEPGTETGTAADTQHASVPQAAGPADTVAHESARDAAEDVERDHPTPPPTVDSVADDRPVTPPRRPLATGPGPVVGVPAASEPDDAPLRAHPDDADAADSTVAADDAPEATPAPDGAVLPARTETDDEPTTAPQPPADLPAPTEPAPTEPASTEPGETELATTEQPQPAAGPVENGSAERESNETETAAQPAPAPVEEATDESRAEALDSEPQATRDEPTDADAPQPLPAAVDEHEGESEDDTRPLKPALEAVLMVVDEPVTEAHLAKVLDRGPREVVDALRELADEYAIQGRGFELRYVAGGWRYYTRPEYAYAVEEFVLDGQQARLTQAALETLAVVAYRQPVSRSRVSAVRGVNCDGVMRTLLQRGLLEEVGTEPETGAILYGTTHYFLERMGLRGLEELPELAPYLPEADAVEGDSAEGVPSFDVDAGGEAPGGASERPQTED